MGFLEDLQNKARGIVGTGKQSLYTANPAIIKPKVAPATPVFGVPTRATVPRPSLVTQTSTPQQTNLTTKDMVEGAVKGGIEVAKFGKEVLQGTNRAVASVGITAGNVALPGQPFPSEINASNNRFSRAVLGDETVKDLPTYGQAGLDFIEQTTGKKPSEKLALPLAALGIFSELSGVAKPAKSLIKESLEASTKSQAFNVLKRAGVSDDVIKSNNLDELIAGAKDEATVRTLLNNLTPKKKINAVTDDVVDTLPRTADGEVDAFKYAELQNTARESAKETRTISDKLGSVKNEIFDKMVDFTGPIQRAYQKGIKTDRGFAVTQTDKTNVNDYVDRVFNAPAITTGFLKDKGFDEVVQTIGTENLGYFDQYLIARRAQDLRARGITTGRDTEKLVKADEAVLKQMGPRFEEQARKIDGFVQARLDYMVDAGLLSPQQAKTLREVDPRYVPFQRTFSEDELMAMGGTNGSRGVASNSGTGIEKMTGSVRQIESPLESLLGTTEKMIVRAEKNKAAKAIVSYKDVQGNPFGLRQLKKTTDAEKGKDTISVFIDGKKQIWEVDADIAKAAKALDVQRLNIFGKILAAPLRVARIGITGIAPGFVAKNVVRDQVSAFILSENGLRSSVANPRVWTAGLAEAIKHGKLYDEIVGQGALMTSVDYTRDALRPTLKQIAESKNKFNSVVFNAKNPSKWFNSLEDIVSRSEQATRIQQYKGAYESAIARGVDAETAKILAARAARENSTNFARRGEWGTVMNNVFLYLNAGIQGSRRMVRSFQKNPKSTAAKIALTYGMPTAAFTYWNMSDPDRKAAYDELQDWEKETSMIIIPPNATKDENGRLNVIKIPLQPGLGEFANATRRAIEASYGGDPVGFKEAATRMLTTVQPVNIQNPLSQAVPQAIKPSIEVATNKSLFTGNPIVPRNLEGLDPSVQYFSKKEGASKNTSGTAKLLADTLGMSPIKTEYFINATLGSVARNVLNTTDKALAAAGVIDPEQIGGEDIGQSITKGFTSAAGGKKEGAVLEEIYNTTAESKTQGEVLKREGYKIYQSLADMSPQEANAQLKQIKAENPALFEKIKDAKEAADLDLSSEEKALKSAPVTDGTRAKLIFKRAQEIRDQEGPEAANAYIATLREKRVISKDVLKQLKDLSKQ